MNSSWPSADPLPSHPSPVVHLSDSSYPQCVQSTGSDGSGSSFARTMREMEDRFYETFPAARAAQMTRNWAVNEGEEGTLQAAHFSYGHGAGHLYPSSSSSSGSGSSSSTAPHPSSSQMPFPSSRNDQQDDDHQMHVDESGALAGPSYAASPDFHRHNHHNRHQHHQAQQQPMAIGFAANQQLHESVPMPLMTSSMQPGPPPPSNPSSSSPSLSSSPYHMPTVRDTVPSAPPTTNYYNNTQYATPPPLMYEEPTAAMSTRLSQSPTARSSSSGQSLPLPLHSVHELVAAAAAQHSSQMHATHGMDPSAYYGPSPHYRSTSRGRTAAGSSRHQHHQHHQQYQHQQQQQQQQQSSSHPTYPYDVPHQYPYPGASPPASAYGHGSPPPELLPPPWPPQNVRPPSPTHEGGGSSSPTGRGHGHPGRRNSDKKPPLACLFCRGRKIACGPPVPGGDEKTCNQCHRRSLKCEYPAESRRGMRKKSDLANINPDGPKVSMPKSARSKRRTE